MPKTKREAVPRKNVRLPTPLIDEIDGIVQVCGLYVNRQQFIESALREKVEKFKLVEEREATAEVLSQRVDDNFLVRVKETFLAHAIVNMAKENSLPAHHSDQKQFGQRIRLYIKRRAERESREMTKKQLEGLTKEMLKYHREILEGLAVMSSH
jgi:Arc/MetJ-type ribon-helix-helix transcriptional regulator